MVIWYDKYVQLVCLCWVVNPVPIQFFEVYPVSLEEGTS